jgi:hypothetical protein
MEVLLTDSSTGPVPASVVDRQNRLRVQLTMTLHPDTVTRMRGLTERFKVSRGMLIDRLVLILDRQYQDVKVFCMTGEPCRFNRVDVPPIF